METTYSDESRVSQGTSSVEPFREDDWNDLLRLVDQGKVLPVVGDGVVTFGEANSPLQPFLAAKLAESLKVPISRLSEPPSISEVAREHLLNNGVRNQIYSRISRILGEETEKKTIEPGSALQQLADIEAFNLYLSTTCDGLLGQAISQARNRACTTLAFCPNAPEKDLPCRAAKLDGPTVYHLLGRASGAPGEYVAWEEDLLDFLSELPKHLGTDAMRNLSLDLRSHALLAVGLRFSDWVLRLLLRIARQEPLSKVEFDSWFAEGSAAAAAVAPSTVLFFGAINRTSMIRVIECATPSDFVAELHRRWRERHSARPLAPGPSAPQVPSRPEQGLVFISYAREDEAAARRIEQGLLGQGCSVYLDRQRLGPAMNFHHELEDQVEQKCAVFLSVVSAFTESAGGDNYFHLERNWAAERLKRFAESDQPNFYIPVCIQDQVPKAIQREPRAVKHFQWLHCPGGVVSPDFGKRVAELQRNFERKFGGQP